MRPHVREAATLLAGRFGISTVGGWRALARDMGGHPAGLAVDFMCTKAQGDALSAYVAANHQALGVDYQIWWQQLWTPRRGWSAMADRGSPTQNHLDHVHVQWKSGAVLALDGLTDGTGSGKIGTGSGTSGGGLGGVGEALSGLNPFSGWQDDAQELGIKVVVVVAGLALVVLGLVRGVR